VTHNLVTTRLVDPKALPVVCEGERWYSCGVKCEHCVMVRDAV